MQFWRRISRNSKRDKIRNAKITEVMDVQKDIPQVIEED